VGVEHTGGTDSRTESTDSPGPGERAWTLQPDNPGSPGQPSRLESIRRAREEQQAPTVEGAIPEPGTQATGTRQNDKPRQDLSETSATDPSDEQPGTAAPEDAEETLDLADTDGQPDDRGGENEPELQDRTQAESARTEDEPGDNAQAGADEGERPGVPDEEESPDAARADRLEGVQDYVVDDPVVAGRTITDIDRIENGVLWEEKTATDATDVQRWVSKHIDKKFASYVEARQHLAGYEDAPIGFCFTRPGVDALFKSEVESAVDRLRSSYPNVQIFLEWQE
jgi:hypothetical protein